MSNYITNFLKSNKNIGAKNGIKATDILSALGRNTSEDSKRQLKAEIRRFRVAWRESDSIDEFILSDTEHGYFLINNITEAERFVNSQHSRAIKAFETSKYIRKYLQNRGD